MYAFAQQTYNQKMNSLAGANKYRQEESLNMTPVQVILKLYDLVILSCKKNDKRMAGRALNELIVSLNFEHKEMAIGLYQLYDYSKRCVFAGRLLQAEAVVSELRSAWAQAFHLK